MNGGRCSITYWLDHLLVRDEDGERVELEDLGGVAQRVVVHVEVLPAPPPAVLRVGRDRRVRGVLRRGGTVPVHVYDHGQLVAHYRRHGSNMSSNALDMLRETLMVMTGRPVNIQASRELVLQFRGGLLDQPYLTIVDDTADTVDKLVDDPADTVDKLVDDTTGTLDKVVDDTVGTVGKVVGDTLDAADGLLDDPVGTVDKVVDDTTGTVGKVVEDTTGDGKPDRRTVFTEGLNLVSGLEVGYGGVWVGSPPHLLFIPVNAAGDAPAGEPEELLDGWGYQDTHETLNAFIWGPDGWLYGCHGVFTHSRVGKPGTPDELRTPINAGVWRYHPIRHEFEVFAWGKSNPWGVDFDEHGRAFVSACVIPHLYQLTQGGRCRAGTGTWSRTGRSASPRSVPTPPASGASTWRALGSPSSATRSSSNTSWPPTPSMATPATPSATTSDRRTARNRGSNRP